MENIITDLQNKNLYLFVLGRNPLLSIAELLAYFQKINLKLAFIQFSPPLLILELQTLPQNLIDHLGGTLKISKAYFELNQKPKIDKLKQTITKIDFTKLITKNKSSFFGVSTYTNLHGFSSSSLNYITALEIKQQFKNQIKYFLPPTRHVGFNRTMTEPKTNRHAVNNRSELTHVEILKRKILDSGEMLLFVQKNKTILAKTLQIHNPFEFEKRDIKKPKVRSILGISPRLSKILVNLTKINSGTLLDPFCGVGSILMEAALEELQIKGADIDKQIVEDARQNLEWLSKEYNLNLQNIQNNLFDCDIKNLTNYLKQNSIDAVATEPNLGPPLKEIPTKQEVEKILKQLRPQYEIAFQQTSKLLKPNKRLVIISPRFLIGKYPLRLDMITLAKKANLKLIDPLEGFNLAPHKTPLIDFHRKSKLIREIYIFEKTLIEPAKNKVFRGTGNP